MADSREKILNNRDHSWDTAVEVYHLNQRNPLILLVKVGLKNYFTVLVVMVGAVVACKAIIYSIKQK